LSASWASSRLGDVAHIEMGQSPPSEFVSDHADNSGVPFLQGNAEFTAKHPVARLRCSRPTKTCREGDALISVRAPVGALNLADRAYCIGRGLAAITFQKADPRFGFHALALYSRALRRVAQGTTFEAVGSAELRALDFPSCPLPEQRRIAEILDTLDEAIRKTEQLIEKLKLMKQGLLHDLLTRGIDDNGELRDPERHPEQFRDSPLGTIPTLWDTPKIEDIAIHVGSGLTPRGGSEVYRSQGILFLRSQNVHFDGLRLDDVAYISPTVHASMARSEVFAFDVLLNITGASIGRVCWLPAGLGPVNVNQHVCAIRLATAFEPDAQFLAAVLGSHVGQHQIYRLNAGGNREGLNYEQLRSFVVPWPSPAERTAIASRLNAVAERLRAEGAAHSKLTLLKHGLADDLLTGRVRVPVGEEVTA